MIATDGRNRTGYSIAAANQQQGVEQTQAAVEQPLLGIKQCYMAVPGEGIGDKQRPKHQQLGKDEQPDGQVAG